MHNWHMELVQFSDPNPNSKSLLVPALTAISLPRVDPLLLPQQLRHRFSLPPSLLLQQHPLSSFKYVLPLKHAFSSKQLITSLQHLPALRAPYASYASPPSHTCPMGRHAPHGPVHQHLPALRALKTTTIKSNPNLSGRKWRPRPHALPKCYESATSRMLTSK